MQIKLTHTNDTNVVIHITADQETLSKIKESILRKLSKSVKIAGFREGKAPLEMVEKNIEPSTLQSEFIDQVLNHYYFQAVTKENLRVVGQPEVNLKKFVPFTTFEFEVTVSVIGEVKLPDYNKISVPGKKATVSAKDVTDVIESLRKRLATKKEVKRAAKDGDELLIDFKGTDTKGQPVNGADGKGYPLTIGSDTFIPGFESNLIGVKPGEEKTFIIPFPKDYGVAALQGKKVTFAVTVHTVSELSLPKIDDEFAKQAGPFTSLDHLKEDIKQQLTLERQNELDRARENVSGSYQGTETMIGAMIHP